MTTTQLLSKPYKFLDNAFQDAAAMANETKETFYIIETRLGYEVVTSEFNLSRMYYHGQGGEKMFFTPVETVTPKI